MITSFGSINLDFVVALPRLPRPGETVSGPDHQTFPGGKGANQALAARRAGADVRMVGAVGRDPFAELALANLRASDVDLSGVRALDGTTGLAFIGVDSSGQNQIMVASGTNKRVSASWLRGALHPGETLMMQGEVPGPEVMIAIEAAHTAGARIFWNPAPIPDKAHAGLARAVDVLVVNEGEAEEIGAFLDLPGDPAGFVKALITPDRVVAVTLGSDGVVAGRGADMVRIRPPRVEVRDTTGAGDAFCGALAAALDRDTPLERALREAIAAGSLACTATGAQSSAPEAREIALLADTLKPE